MLARHSFTNWKHFHVREEVNILKGETRKVFAFGIAPDRKAPRTDKVLLLAGSPKISRDGSGILRSEVFAGFLVEEVPT